MNISHNFYYGYSNKLNFTSNTGYYKSVNGNGMGTSTCMFRNDLDWEGFTDYLTNHFKDKKNVNFLQFAASDGSEAYTQIISLLEHPDDTEKFFPIKAYDINSDMCEIAKSGLINLDRFDRTKIYLKEIDFDKYFGKSNENVYIENDSLKTGSYNTVDTYKVKGTLKNRVNFQRADMFDVMSEHRDDSNSVVLCRNVLNYFSDREAENFTLRAASRLKKGSVFVIGEIDHPRIDKMLLTNGFKEVMPCVFEKI